MSDYLIWSNEHRGWWGKDRSGYTRSVTKAGVYSRDEAIEICKGALLGSGEIPNELPVSLTDAEDFGLGAQIWWGKP